MTGMYGANHQGESVVLEHVDKLQYTRLKVKNHSPQDRAFNFRNMLDSNIRDRLISFIKN